VLSSDKLGAGWLRDLGGKGSLRPGALDRVLARVRRPLDRAFERRATALDALARLNRSVTPALAGADAEREGGRKPRVLVVSLRGWSTHTAYELTIAHALRLRGAEVALLTCGGGMPACELGWARRAYPRPCDRCAWLTELAAREAGVERHRLADWLPWGGDGRQAPLEHAGVQDEHKQTANVSAGWLLKTTQPERVPGAQAIVADFAVAAAGVEAAAAKILDRVEPDVVFLLNGLFAAERTIRRLALERDMRAPTYELAPRGGALVLSQDAPAPDYSMDRLWEQVRGRPLDERQRADVLSLLGDRAQGVGAHESYYERMHDDPGELRRRLGIERDERIVSLFTNVTWDSATLGRDVGFRSMFDWVEQAVRLAAGRELKLVVRIHPAERRWGTREQVREVIDSRLGEIPANVRFVAAEEPLSSYALLDLSDLLLTYTTTVGLEAAARGKSVAVAGDTHYRGRGFTTDIGGPRELEQALARPAQPLSHERTELALRYAHMFFLRAMIPFGAVQTQGGRVARVPRRASDLQQGGDPYLDWICERILDGGEFGLPDELACATD
jgi:hypothetical protein